MIKEIDIVALTVDLPANGLKAGDIGTVVHVYRDGGPYEVEFVALNGATIALITLASNDVREVDATEIPSARSVA
jgi:hypothetical protein